VDDVESKASAIDRSAPALASTTRSVAIDLVRMLGLLIVVTGHVWTDLPIVGYVAIFFVIAGYLWSDRRPMQDEIRHRARILVVPYISWLVIIGSANFVGKALGGETPYELVKLLANYVLGGSRIVTPLTAYWFLTAIFFATIIYRYLRTRSSLVYRGAIAVALLMTLAFPYVGKLPLSLGVGFCCIVFIAAGHGFRRIEALIPMPVLLAAITLAICLLLIYGNVIDRMVLKVGDFGTQFLSIAVAVLISCAALTLSRPLAQMLPVSAGSRVTAFVRFGTPIITLHTVPLWLLPEDTNGWLRLLCALALPMLVGNLLLAFPAQSTIRELLMPARAA
jgi:acyltransferase